MRSKNSSPYGKTFAKREGSTPHCRSVIRQKSPYGKKTFETRRRTPEITAGQNLIGTERNLSQNPVFGAENKKVSCALPWCLSLA
jgi:hypothetical protein